MRKNNTEKHTTVSHFTQIDFGSYADIVGDKEPDEVLRLGAAEVHTYDHGQSHKVFIVDCLSGKVLVRECQGGYSADKKTEEEKSIMAAFSCIPKNRE